MFCLSQAKGRRTYYPSLNIPHAFLLLYSIVPIPACAPDLGDREQCVGPRADGAGASAVCRVQPVLFHQAERLPPAVHWPFIVCVCVFTRKIIANACI